MQDEIIIHCGVEGGDWTLLGRRRRLGGWRFRAVRDEGTLLDLMSEEDRAGFEAYEETVWVLSFEAGLVLFDEHPWPAFYPLGSIPSFESGYGRLWKRDYAVSLCFIRNAAWGRRSCTAITGSGCATGGRQGDGVQRRLRTVCSSFQGLAI